jgi:hypothetical protein
MHLTQWNSFLARFPGANPHRIDRHQDHCCHPLPGHHRLLDLILQIPQFLYLRLSPHRGINNHR